MPTVQQLHIYTATRGPGLRTPSRSALQQGERAQERAFRSSWEVDGHRRQCKFTLPGWLRADVPLPEHPAPFKRCQWALKSRRYRHEVRCARV